MPAIGAECAVGTLVEISSDGFERRLRQMRKGVLTSARLIQEELQNAGVPYRSALVTLTYRSGEEWAPCDINALLAHYRKWAKRRSAWVRYVWTLELTKAGRPHYHIVLFLPRGVTPPLPDKQGWWRKGMTNAKWARSPVGYIAKYASKGGVFACELPKGARLWGCSSLSTLNSCRLRWSLAPSWLQKLIPFEDGVSRVRGWWLNASTGWAYSSPWLFDCCRSGAVVLRWIGWTADSVFIPPPPDLSKGALDMQALLSHYRGCLPDMPSHY